MKHLKFIILLVTLAASSNNLHAQNKSLLFNGSSNKVVIPKHSDFDFTTQFTLEAWIYANNWKSNYWAGSLINKDANNAAGQPSGYMIRAGEGGKLDGVITPNWQGTITGAIMDEKKWNHVAMVYKEGEMWIYINGKQESYEDGLPTSINKSPADLQIGESPGWPGRAWDGKIDEVRIWNTARTADQVKQNMTKALQGTEDGLVAYYNFDEDNTSSTLTDKTGNGHNGTLVNYGSTYSWVAGYVVDQIDLSLEKIVNPCNNPDWSSSERIQLEIKNKSFTSVSNFDVAFEYEGKVYTETVIETIEPSQTYIHTFNKFIDLESRDEATIKTYILWDLDEDAENNVLEQRFVRTNTIRLMNRVQHNYGAYGQNNNNIRTLPDDNTKYSQLLLHISIDCPMEGCDPWDQMGCVKIKKDGKEYEIARFITPYGKACGPWTVDVSDFRSVLTGTVDVATYIQVWGPKGWLLTLDLEYVKGDLDEPYSQIIPLYELDGQVYGDPAKSFDLPEQSVAIPGNTKSAQIRMTNTGHGQANTNNAAEFMEAFHHVWINGTDKFTHHLWKDDCSSNSCSPQYGTWQYARAGWCPGQGVTPVWFNLAEDLSPGEDMTIDYVLQDYKNYLNTGYNSGSHTEPFYRIYSYLYLASDLPFENYTDLAVDSVSILDATTEGARKIYMELTNKGSLKVANAEIAYVINNSEATVENVVLNIESGERTSFEFEVTNLDLSQPGLLVVFADTENDQIASNNSKAIGFGDYTSVTNRMEHGKLDVYPNPAKNAFTVKSPGSSISRIAIFDGMGRQVYQNTFIDRIQICTDEIAGSGMFLIKLATKTNTYVEKIVVE